MEGRRRVTSAVSICKKGITDFEASDVDAEFAAYVSEKYGTTERKDTHKGGCGGFPSTRKGGYVSGLSNLNENRLSALELQ